MVKTKILFNIDEVITLINAYRKHHESDDMDDFTHGVIQGLDVVLLLLDRLEP